MKTHCFARLAKKVPFFTEQRCKNCGLQGIYLSFFYHLIQHWCNFNDSLHWWSFLPVDSLSGYTVAAVAAFAHFMIHFPYFYRLLY